MGQWQSADLFLQDRGIDVHYWRTGGSGPKLLLLHGFSDHGRCWTRVAQALEDTYDIIMPDARGHGRSSAPEDAYTREDQAADAASLIQSLELGPVAVMGHSMGAASAAWLAADYPQLVTTVILEDPPFFSGQLDKAKIRTGHAEFKTRWETWHTTPLSKLVEICREQNPGWASIECETWAEAKKQLSENRVRAYPTSSRLWQEVLAAIRCPALLITADPARGGIVTPEVAKEALSLLKQGQWVQISEAGHSIHRDAFTNFIEVVRNFLAQHVSA